MDIQWQYKRGRGVVYVLRHYGMAVWGRGLHQEIWYIVDDYVIYSAPKLKSPVILADGIVSEVNELIISVLSLSSFPASWFP